MLPSAVAETAMQSPMKRRLQMKTVLLLLATMFLETVPLLGQTDDALYRKTLVGLTRISVLLENVDEDAQQRGLSAHQIQTDVELRLRQAGIPVADTSEQGNPYLYVNVQTLRLERGAYVWHLEVQLLQRVALDRNPSNTLLAPTWGSSKLGIIGADKLSQLRDDIRDMVDEFINAFLAANAKK